MTDSLEERRVAAQEKVAEAMLRQAEIAEKRLELAKDEREDRKTLLGGLKSILDSTAGYMNAIARQEFARAGIIEAAQGIRQALPPAQTEEKEPHE